MALRFAVCASTRGGDVVLASDAGPDVGKWWHACTSSWRRRPRPWGKVQVARVATWTWRMQLRGDFGTSQDSCCVHAIGRGEGILEGVRCPELHAPISSTQASG